MVNSVPIAFPRVRAPRVWGGDPGGQFADHADTRCVEASPLSSGARSGVDGARETTTLNLKKSVRSRAGAEARPGGAQAPGRDDRGGEPPPTRRAARSAPSPSLGSQ